MVVMMAPAGDRQPNHNNAGAGDQEEVEDLGMRRDNDFGDDDDSGTLEYLGLGL